MNKVFNSLILVGLTLLSMSASAEFTLDKYRIELTDGERRVDLRLYNSGKQFSSYRVQMIDMAMDEEGKLQKVESYPHSAKKLVRVGPRLVKNITPNSFQKLRIRGRGSKTSGEFRSHLLIEEILPPYEGDVQGMLLRPNLRVIIPIFVGSGELTSSVSGSDYSFDEASGELKFALNRDGNSSVVGNILIENASGEAVHVQNGVAVYREINKRMMTIKLKEAVTSLAGHTLKYVQPDVETILFQHKF